MYSFPKGISTKGNANSFVQNKKKNDELMFYHYNILLLMSNVPIIFFLAYIGTKSLFFPGLHWNEKAFFFFPGLH